MVLIGRLTGNAVVKTLKDERKVVTFGVAHNDYFKPKGSSEGVKVTTFFDCSYWVNPQIQKILTKGSLVELSGRITPNTFKNRLGEAQATLNFHVNSIQIHSRSVAEVNSKSDDELPF